MTPIENLMSKVPWTELPWSEKQEALRNEEKLPHITHEGVLEIACHKLRCYRTSDGQSIINAEDFEALFGRT